VKEMLILIRRELYNKFKVGLVCSVVIGMMALNLGLTPPALGQPQPFQVVVSSAPGVDVGKVAQDVGANVVRRGPLNFATLEFKESNNMPQVIAVLKGTPGIMGAEENYRRSITT